MAKSIKKETIHAKGFEIGIYTEDFQNEYISMTDIAKYKSVDPNNKHILLLTFPLQSNIYGKAAKYT